MKSLTFSIRNLIPALALLFANGVAAQTPKLTLGVFPGVAAGHVESYEIMDRFLPFAQYLSSKVGTQVLLVPVRVPRQAMRSMVEGETTYKLFFGPPVFAAEAIDKAGFVPIVLEKQRIRAAFIVRHDSKLQSIEDFTSKTRFALPVPTLLLAVLARSTLERQGLVPQPGTRMHMPSMESMVLAVDNGLADVAVLRNNGARKIVSSQPSRFRIVGETGDAPGFALIAHKIVPEDMRQKLRRAALALNNDTSSFAAEVRSGLRTSAFAPGHQEDFVALQRMMEAPTLAASGQ